MSKLDTENQFKPYILFPEKNDRESVCSDNSISSICRSLSETLGDLRHWNNIFDSENSHAPISSEKIMTSACSSDLVGIHYPFVSSYDLSSSIKDVMMSADGYIKFENLLKNWIHCDKFYLIHEIVQDRALLCIAATDSNGVYSVMKLIESVKNYYYLSAILASNFQETVLEILKHPVGFQIVACCLENLSYDHNMFLFDAALKHCVRLAKDETGSASLKQIILCSDYFERENILLKIADNAVYLAKHPKGNHVIQFVLEVSDNILFNEYLFHCLEKHLMELATDQSGSYVIQKCIQSFGGELLIESLLLKFDLSKFERLATDAYGNYVLQTAIQKSKGTWLHHELIGALKQLPRELNTNVYASNVFKYIRRHQTLKTE